MVTSNPKSALCSDFVLFATTEFVHLEHYWGKFKGNTLTFNMPGEYAQADVA